MTADRRTCSRCIRLPGGSTIASALSAAERAELLVFLESIDGTTPNLFSEGDLFRDALRLQGAWPSTATLAAHLRQDGVRVSDVIRTRDANYTSPIQTGIPFMSATEAQLLARRRNRSTLLAAPRTGQRCHSLPSRSTVGAAVHRQIESP